MHAIVTITTDTITGTTTVSLSWLGVAIAFMLIGTFSLSLGKA